MVSPLFPVAPTYRVAAYITAYQDAAALTACITALQAQSYTIGQILIVDNSPTPLLEQEEEDVLIWHCPENIGIAAGMARGLAWALAQNYDFLWTFDQDSVPASDCLARLVQTYDQTVRPDYPIGMVAPTPRDARTGEVVQPSQFLGDRFRGFHPPSETSAYECDVPITSGSLVWLGSLREVPPPNPELFIDGIDLDYGLRLRRAGFHNLIVPQAAMVHRFGMPFVVHFGGRKKVFQRYSPLRYYYICRNQTYLELLYSCGGYRVTCSLRRIKFLGLTLLKILVFDAGERSSKIVACLLGTYHGFTGKLGKRWG